MSAAPPVLVALDLPLRAGDAAFTFGAGAASGAPRGAGVVVPFGRRLLPGILLGAAPPREGLRPVLALSDPAAVVPPATVDLAEWTAGAYLSSVGEALAAAVPWDALWDGLRLRWTGPILEGLSGQGRRAAEAIARRPVGLTRAARLLADAPGALAALAEARGLAATLRRDQAAARRSPVGPGRPLDRPDDALLTASLTRADEVVREAMAGGAAGLLIVGWNRTPAYLAAARRALAAGWSCLAAFGSVDAAVGFTGAAADAGLAPVALHGDLPAPARVEAWWTLRGGGPALVAGTRGVVFAPVEDPVLIIVDDEDSAGHKEERAPRYVTAVVAAHRTRARGVLVLGGATPTVASYAGAQAGRLRLVALPSPRPRIGVIDLRRRRDREAPVSRPLLEALRRTVRSAGRAVVLVDRKGYAGGLHCAECGAVVRCPRCGTAMSFARRPRQLRCRLCGLDAPVPDACPRCGAARLHPVGAGTERVAAALRRITPAVWRLDTDVLRRGEGAGDRLRGFRDGGGLLVATLLVLPWLEELRPALVAVVAADRWLHRPEFRAAERALALLRALGMATRERVLVETGDPSHPVIRAVEAANLRAFYADELAQRQALRYPPFAVMAAVTVSGPAPAADAVCRRLAEGATPGVEVLGPSPLPGPMGGRAARGVVLRAADRGSLRATLWPLLTGTGISKGVRIAVDVDPHEL